MGSATPQASSDFGSPTAFPTATPDGTTGAFVPTLESKQPVWVRDRLMAVSSLYRITPKGQEVLASLDVRQMWGEPGFFGSYGFKSWTGVGEAKPIQVIHELSHAYWGAFPITGYPNLSWESSVARGVFGAQSPAMDRYHRDVLAFMAQPPDPYEPLRDRLRKLPELSRERLDPLFHTIEADLVYTVGGDLDLVPPILRKYWDQFLQPGPYHSWYEAIGWYQSLSPQERALANGYLGFEHFDLRDYRGLTASRVKGLPAGIAETLEREERQRLFDFAEQFDQLLGRPGQEDFNFWRGYLGSMVWLHHKYPDYLSSLSLPRAPELASALDFLVSLESVPREQRANMVAERLQTQPFLAHFVPTLDNRTLLTLFTSGFTLPQDATLKGTAAFVQRLKALAPVADQSLALGRQDPAAGARNLASFLETLDLDKERQDLNLLFDLMGDTDYGTTQRVMTYMDAPLLRKLLEAMPARMRSLLQPEQLLGVLDITTSASADKVAQGLKELVTHTSGNYLIDEPFLDQAYDVLVARSQSDPREALELISQSALPMERFIRQHPQDVARILSSDIDGAAMLVARSDTVTFPPARFIYSLIGADPVLAARLVEALDARQYTSLVRESLVHMAYDKDRLEAVPTLPISLEKDGLFLAQLLARKGQSWLLTHLREAVQIYQGHVALGNVPANFLGALSQTLEAAVATLPPGGPRNSLQEVLSQALPQP